MRKCPMLTIWYPLAQTIIDEPGKVLLEFWRLHTLFAQRKI